MTRAADGRPVTPCRLRLPSRTSMTSRRPPVVRLPAKERALVEILSQYPASLAELRELPLVRRRIGRGYVEPILTALLREGTLACTNGIFWVRSGKTAP